jgi:hypothetical protein
MQDGFVITINKTTKYYPTEEDFFHNVRTDFPHTYMIENVEKMEYEENKHYEVIGYNQDFVGCWEKAKFGNWAENYGLTPNKIYYVSTKLYAKYVSKPDNTLMIVPEKGLQNMGYCPGLNDKTFCVEQDNVTNTNILTTSTRFIGYNSEGNHVQCTINSFTNNKLIWKFLILQDVWD